MMRMATVLALMLGIHWSAAPAAAAEAEEKTPSFVKDVKPFLAKYCTECHGGNQTKAGVNLTSYDNLMKGSKKKKVVVAGKPDDSALVKTLTGAAKKMPPKSFANQPSKEEIDMIKAWIMAGTRMTAPTPRAN